jgi:hypothetical protein
VGPPSWLRFVERPFPSANMMVIAGSKPVLVDSGYGSNLTRTVGLLGEQGLGPAGLSLVVNVRVGCARLVLSTVSSFLWAGSRGVASPAGPFLYLTPLLYQFY